MNLDEHNKFVKEQVHRFGNALNQHGDFTYKMIALESITAAMIAMVAITENKQPEALLETFIKGLTGELDKAIYGKKQ